MRLMFLLVHLFRGFTFLTTEQEEKEGLGVTRRCIRGLHFFPKKAVLDINRFFKELCFYIKIANTAMLPLDIQKIEFFPVQATKVPFYCSNRSDLACRKVGAMFCEFYYPYFL